MKQSNKAKNEFPDAIKGKNKPRNYRTVDKTPSLTKQSFKDSTDINQIMARAKATGLLGTPNLQPREPMFGDFTDGSSYHEQCNKIHDAQDAFMALDPKIRQAFKNDPVKLLDFISKKENRDEAIKLGLIQPGDPSDKLLKQSTQTDILEAIKSLNDSQQLTQKATPQTTQKEAQT